MNSCFYIDIKKGKGKTLFAKRDIKKDEVIFIICGPIIDEATIFSIPIGLNAFIDPIPFNHPARYICHDCEPNAGIRESTLLVAMRDIKKDEEIAVDYAMFVLDYGNEMTDDNIKCNCYKPNCRGILGSYKSLPFDLKNKYKGYISDYLKKQ